MFINYFCIEVFSWTVLFHVYSPKLFDTNCVNDTAVTAYVRSCATWSAGCLNTQQTLPSRVTSAHDSPMSATPPPDTSAAVCCTTDCLLSTAVPSGPTSPATDQTLASPRSRGRKTSVNQPTAAELWGEALGCLWTKITSGLLWRNTNSRQLLGSCKMSRLDMSLLTFMFLSIKWVYPVLDC